MLSKKTSARSTRTSAARTSSNRRNCAGIFPDETGPAAVAFPGGVIVNPAALRSGTGSDQFLEIVAHALAHEWFGDAMYIAPDAAVGMGEGLPEYATIVIDEARNGADARRKRVTEYLRRYDEASKRRDGDSAGRNHDRRCRSVRAASLSPRLRFSSWRWKTRAAKRRCAAGWRTACRCSAGARRATPTCGSALEESSNRDLAGMFRLWLNGKGIPEDFRQRYQGSAVGEVAQK